MKLKTLATLTVSGLMAASLAYVMPAFAEEGEDIEAAPMQMAMADDATPRTPDINAGNTAADAANHAVSASNANNAATPTGDQQGQGTPDVASGDDDY